MTDDQMSARGSFSTITSTQPTNTTLYTNNKENNNNPKVTEQKHVTIKEDGEFFESDITEEETLNSVVETVGIMKSTTPTPTLTPGFLHNKVLSLSTTSIKSLLPNFYSITSGNNSTNSIYLDNNASNVSLKDSMQSHDPLSIVSDELARESDVTVSTTVTPQAEYKGFASYVISCIFLFVWICWSFLPDRVLNQLGVYYYPSRWWALAIPSYVLVVMMYMYIAIALYDIELLTLPLNDNRNIVDDSGIVVTQLKNFKPSDMDRYLSNGTSGVWDLPISVVNHILYSNPENEQKEKLIGTTNDQVVYT
ncbi:hypothetical protein C6P40_003411 [Pichia californica]|uniref:PIG-P domain-containing protein n=1 Tax=Pichia californica TaxID=460514 RepID=A0A9P6WGL5_9ASCO|nr:hypothetical protein C6P42_002675 [[Candida] californica]KAG0686770.1 hypothetical protein C6P40_003411 [[Candida] californica]